jgi:hypothetical protein
MKQNPYGGEWASGTNLSRTRHWAADITAPHTPSLGRYCAGDVCLSHASSATWNKHARKWVGLQETLRGEGGRPHLSLEDETLGRRNERPAQA